MGEFMWRRPCVSACVARPRATCRPTWTYHPRIHGQLFPKTRRTEELGMRTRHAGSTAAGGSGRLRSLKGSFRTGCDENDIRGPQKSRSNRPVPERRRTRVVAGSMRLLKAPKLFMIVAPLGLASTKRLSNLGDSLTRPTGTRRLGFAPLSSDFSAFRNRPHRFFIANQPVLRAECASRVCHGRVHSWCS